MIKLTFLKELCIKASASKECNFCNRCYDLLMMSTNLSDIAVLNIIGSDYRCITSLISKNEAIKLIQNADLTEKSRTLLNIKMHKKTWILSDLLRNF